MKKTYNLMRDKKKKRCKLSFYRKNKKGAIELDILGWWVLGLAVLGLVLVGYFIFKGKGDNAIDTIKNILKFGR